MHTRLYVTVNKDKHIETSEDARNFVQTYLESEDSGFISGGRFGGGCADWFIVGGRWSGALTKGFTNFQKETNKLGNQGSFGLSNEDIKKYGKKLQKLWENEGNKTPNPYDRDTYRTGIYEDDAMLIDKDTYKLLKEYEGENESYSDAGLVFFDHDWDDVSKNFIGKKWIIVVDYHI